MNLFRVGDRVKIAERFCFSEVEKHVVGTIRHEASTWDTTSGTLRDVFHVEWDRGYPATTLLDEGELERVDNPVFPEEIELL